MAYWESKAWNKVSDEDHPGALTGDHDIMDGVSSVEDSEVFHTIVRGTVWPGFRITNDNGDAYTLTECYEEYGSAFRWFCQPVQKSVQARAETLQNGNKTGDLLSDIPGIYGPKGQSFDAFTSGQTETVSPAPRIQVTGWIAKEGGKTKMIEDHINIIPTQHVIAVGGKLYDVERMGKDQRLLKPREE